MNDAAKFDEDSRRVYAGLDAQNNEITARCYQKADGIKLTYYLGLTSKVCGKDMIVKWAPAFAPRAGPPNLRAQSNKVHEAWLGHFGSADVSDRKAAIAIKREGEDPPSSPVSAKKHKKGPTDSATKSPTAKQVPTRKNASGKHMASPEELISLLQDGAELTKTQVSAVSWGPAVHALHGRILANCFPAR
jgi:hypothetical protein